MSAPIFKRILLKISGEALAATQGFGVDTTRIHEIAAELADVNTLAIWMPRVFTSASSAAISWMRVVSTPKPCVAARASPEIFSRMRLKIGSDMAGRVLHFAQND